MSTERMSSINGLLCDRCGQPARFDSAGGNCPECGDDLCIACAGHWHEEEEYNGLCDQCFRDETAKAMQADTPESLWSRYWQYECTIRQYCFGTDPDRVLKKMDTEIPVAEHERVKILRILGFEPNSATVWIGVNKEGITVMGKTYRPGRIFAGEGREPHSRFAVLDGFED